MRGIRLCAVAALGWSLGGVGGAQAADADWMTDDGNVLELKLAHKEPRRLDGGVLRVDRGKKLLLWEGIAGEIGCQLKIEASFDDVKSVELDDRQPGFELRLKSGKAKELRLIPVPHAAVLLQETQLGLGGIQSALENAPGLQGPDGGSMRTSGGAAGAGPNTKRLEIPKEAVADTNTAADSILKALGRSK